MTAPTPPYWFTPMPRARLTVLSRIVGLVVLYTVFVTDQWAGDHAFAPESFWQPIALARGLGLPPPTEFGVLAVRLVLVLCVVLTFVPRRLVDSRLVRAAQIGMFGAYTVWCVWAFSFSKVDHDRLTIVVALAVMALVPVAPVAPGGGRAMDPMVGWAIRTIQVVFILSYPLSAVSKIRKSGWEWVDSAVFSRAIIRRGSMIGDWFLGHQELLRFGQYAFIFFEFAAVLALSRNRRVRNAVLWGVLGLHVFTYVTIGIHFLPHSIFLVAFLPLERIAERVGERWAGRGPVAASGPAVRTS